jgi:hypothetical protein
MGTGPGGGGGLAYGGYTARGGATLRTLHAIASHCKLITNQKQKKIKILKINLWARSEKQNNRESIVNFGHFLHIQYT